MPRDTSNSMTSDAKAGKAVKVMDAKYNKLMDNLAFRLALNVSGFALWLVAAVAFLKVA